MLFQCTNETVCSLCRSSGHYEIGQFLTIRNTIKRLGNSVEKSIVPEGVSILRHVSYFFCYVCVKYVCAGAASVITRVLPTMFCFSF